MPGQVSTMLPPPVSGQVSTKYLMIIYTLYYYMNHEPSFPSPNGTYPRQLRRRGSYSCRNEERDSRCLGAGLSSWLVTDGGCHSDSDCPTGRYCMVTLYTDPSDVSECGPLLLSGCTAHRSLLERLQAARWIREFPLHYMHISISITKHASRLYEMNNITDYNPSVV